MRKSTPGWSFPAEILRIIFTSPKRFFQKKDKHEKLDDLKQTVDKCSEAANQMMAKMGWQPGKGLGKNEQGVKADPNEDKKANNATNRNQAVDVSKIYKRMRGLIALFRWTEKTRF